MSVLHALKLHKNFWDVVMAGEKTFEVRNNDRGFQKGDIVVFSMVSDSGPIGSAEDDKKFMITYVLSGWGIKEGHVVFGIKPL